MMVFLGTVNEKYDNLNYLCYDSLSNILLIHFFLKNKIKAEIEEHRLGHMKNF